LGIAVSLLWFSASATVRISSRRPKIEGSSGRVANRGSEKRGAVSVNAAIAILNTLLLFGAGPRFVPQEQDNESQPVDQVEVNKNMGTVQKVDAEKRKLTVRLDSGKTKTFRVDKGVKNLDQFHPGDRVQVSSTEEIVMTADKSSDTAGVAKYGVVGVTPEGENPAIVKVETTEVEEELFPRIRKKRRITFEDPQGKKRTLKPSKKINNLDQFKPGENLNMAVTDGTAIEVVK
jgi:Cu/Ag efflux protein CusF